MRLIKHTTPRACSLHMVVMVFLSAYAAGCAGGQHASGGANPGRQDPRSLKRTAVVFIDLREEVVSGLRKPNFCGHIGSFEAQPGNDQQEEKGSLPGMSGPAPGMSFMPLQTDDGRSLAEQFASLVSNSYKKQGYPFEVLSAKSNVTRDAVLRFFKTDGSRDRLLLFTIREWESNAWPVSSFSQYGIICDLGLEIFDKNGELLASELTSASQTRTKGEALDLQNLAILSDEVFREQVGRLFSREAVKKSL